MVVLEKFAETAIIDRHEANGVLFDKFFTDPDFRRIFLNHLAGVYDDIRDEEAS
jgi:type I restriction enzyme R subunit